MRQSWSPRSAPVTWSMVALTAFALGRFVCSMTPAAPLSARNGFAEAVTHLEAQLGPETFVLVWPPEQAAALTQLPPAWKAADAVPIESGDRRRFLEVLVLGPSGFTTPPELRGAEAGKRDRFGDVEVGDYRWPRGDRIDFDLRADLAAASVRLVGGGQDLHCDRSRSGGGWSCPGQPSWNHVGPTVLKVEGRDWPAVWAHPVSGRELVIDLGPRELWDRVEVEAALHDDATGGQRATVAVLLEVEGIGSRRLLRTDARGVVKATLSTPRGQVAPVHLRVSAAKDGRRHVGVNLRILEVR